MVGIDQWDMFHTKTSNDQVKIVGIDQWDMFHIEMSNDQINMVSVDQLDAEMFNYHINMCGISRSIGFEEPFGRVWLM